MPHSLTCAETWPLLTGQRHSCSGAHRHFLEKTGWLLTFPDLLHELWVALSFPQLIGHVYSLLWLVFTLLPSNQSSVSRLLQWVCFTEGELTHSPLESWFSVSLGSLMCSCARLHIKCCDFFIAFRHRMHQFCPDRYALYPPFLWFALSAMNRDRAGLH